MTSAFDGSRTEAAFQPPDVSSPPFAVPPLRATVTILGIDPGITGGIAFLAPDGSIRAFDIPTAGGEVDVDTLVRLVREVRPGLAVIERAGAMPSIPGIGGVRRTMGNASTFKFGVAYGALRTVVALSDIPYHLVTPGKWKGRYGLGADKEKSRAMAIRLWPGCGLFTRKKDHGRAEAALIARYGSEVYG